MFGFNLSETTIENWMALYAAAIRCNVALYGQAFVFVGFASTTDTDEEGKPMPEWAHFAVLWFDIASNRQVFIDPSRILRTSRDGQSVCNFFRYRHVWVPMMERPRLLVVDSGISTRVPSVQHCFSGSIRPMAKQLDNLDGSCTTVSLLIVLLCLRFGCRDPQVMVNYIRCAMHTRRRSFLGQPPTCAGAVQLTAYLLKLRAWQNGLQQPTSTADLPAALGLAAPPGSAPCNYMMYNADGVQYKLCPEPCTGGLVWCQAHAPEQNRTDLDAPTGLYHVLLYLPNSMRSHTVVVSGYFESRWSANDWQCSFATIRDQLGQNVWKSGVGAMRFHGFIHDKKVDVITIQSLLRRTECHRMNSLSAFVVQLLVNEAEEDVDIISFHDFLKMVAASVMLLQWPIAMVCKNIWPYMMVLNMSELCMSADDVWQLAITHRMRSYMHVCFQMAGLHHLEWFTETLKNHTEEMKHLRFHLVFPVSAEAHIPQRKLQKQLIALGDEIFKTDPGLFWTPWFNDTSGQIVPDSQIASLYLTVRNRVGVNAPDGIVRIIKDRRVYAESFLLAALLLPESKKRRRSKA